jgi:hypothetical protein
VAWPIHAHGQPLAVKPYVTYNQDRVEVFFRGSELKPSLDRLLVQNLKLGEIHKTDTQKLSIKNPRVAFKDGAIVVRLDYSAETRGMTEVPAPTFNNPRNKKKVFTPWASDSGWIEFDLRTGVSNWVFEAHTRSGYVRWSSNNQFTRMFSSLIDDRIRNEVARTVNQAIAAELPGRRFDLRQELLTKGPPLIAQQVGRPVTEVRQTMTQALGTVRLDARVNGDGIMFWVSMPKSLFLASSGTGQSGGGTLPSTGRTEFVTSEGNRFIKGFGANWIETRPNGTRNQFHEVRRDGTTSIELFDANRKMYVMLTANQGLWRMNSSQPWRPWPNSNGRWVR